MNTLEKVKGKGHEFMGNVKTAHSRIPIKYLRGLFNAQSPRGATATLHHGDGNDRIFVYAWNEPGWKGGKAPKKAKRDCAGAMRRKRRGSRRRRQGLRN